MGSVEAVAWPSVPVGSWDWSDDGWAAGEHVLPTLLGVDEAGRGPLAGPVSVAAVVLSPAVLAEPPDWFGDLDDSKRLGEDQREALFPKVIDVSTGWAIAHLHAAHIDRVNILQATYHGMSICTEAALGLALSTLAAGPDIDHRQGSCSPAWYGAQIGLEPLLGAHVCSGGAGQRESGRAVQVLVDGNKRFKAAGSRAADFTQHPIVKGDGLSYHIAAASILAKVSRDAVMKVLDGLYPIYGFASHKGYPTVAHREAVRTMGPSPHHRASFKVS